MPCYLGKCGLGVGSSSTLGYHQAVKWDRLFPGNRETFPSPGDLPDPGIECASPALAGGFFTTEPPGKPTYRYTSLVVLRFYTHTHTHTATLSENSDQTKLFDIHFFKCNCPCYCFTDTQKLFCSVRINT